MEVPRIPRSTSARTRGAFKPIARHLPGAGGSCAIIGPQPEHDALSRYEHERAGPGEAGGRADLVGSAVPGSSQRGASDVGLVLRYLRDARFAHGLRCPRCRHAAVTRWGSFSGRQRYRCSGCRRTFSDLTATPAAYLKKLGRFATTTTPAVLELSIRRAADILQVSRDTAFRWRHLICGALEKTSPVTLEGWIELAHFQLAESRKGQKVEGRAPRRRGVWPLVGYGGRRVSVQVAADRVGHVLAAPFAGEPHGRAWLDLLESRLRGPVVLLAAIGPLGRYGSLARRIGVPYLDTRTQHGRSTLEHVETARAFATRFRAWLRRFRGVASSYLGNYLAWYGWLDPGIAFPNRAYRWVLGHEQT
jgi:transposase-like protein